jgi:hypothetical protein
MLQHKQHINHRLLFQQEKIYLRGGFDQGAKSLATGLMSPSGMVAGASLGTQGVMNSQELFEQQMRDS